MSEKPTTVRSYQRIFRPERRIYSIEGRALPIPGGIPLRWLAYASGTLVAGLALGSRSITLALLSGAVVAAAGGAQGGGMGAALGAIAGFIGAELAGLALSLIDWPIRLIVLPTAVASLATQGTPDGRSAERFLASWLALRLAPRRRSLARSIAEESGEEASVWVAADERSFRLRRAWLHGPCSVEFGIPVERVSRRHGDLVRRLGWRRRRGKVVTALELGAGERIEVRP